ncbi:MAG: alpha/beta fold hydrolase [Micromonosporaceae bacterium]
MTGVRERELVVGGIRTVLREAAPEAGPASGAREAVVFVHGNPGPSSDWVGLAGGAGEFARAVAWDQPGFGKADKPRDFPHTVPGHADFIDGAVRALGLDRVHLVLHDFGGPWGLEWAAAHPERVASLVLVNTGVLLGYRWHTLARIWQTPVLGELFMAAATRGGTTALLRRTDPGLSPAALDAIYHAGSHPETKRAVRRLYRASKQRMVDQWSAQAAARLRGLDVPVLVLWGARDAYLPVAQAYRQREVFPQAEVVELADSGHWPFLDNPDAVAGAVLPFLRRVVGSTAYH